MRLNFNFYISNLKKAALGLLETGDANLSLPGVEANAFLEYAGGLDRESLLDALSRLAPQFPVVLVAYANGRDFPDLRGVLEGDPVPNKHICGFVVVVASSDLRGNGEQLADVRKMIGQTRDLLGGVQFEFPINVEGKDEPRIELLNHQPFVPAGVDPIEQLPDLTAFACSFMTVFNEWTPSRRVTVDPHIDEINLNIGLEINPLGHSLLARGGLPGVVAGDKRN